MIKKKILEFLGWNLCKDCNSLMERSPGYGDPLKGYSKERCSNQCSEAKA